MKISLDEIIKMKNFTTLKEFTFSFNNETNFSASEEDLLECIKFLNPFSVHKVVSTAMECYPKNPNDHLDIYLIENNKIYIKFDLFYKFYIIHELLLDDEIEKSGSEETKLLNIPYSPVVTYETIKNIYEKSQRISEYMLKFCPEMK